MDIPPGGQGEEDFFGEPSKSSPKGVPITALLLKQSLRTEVTKSLRDEVGKELNKSSIGLCPVQCMY
jgi:hypothetical protein